MEYWHIIILGVVQGITEFLPISSSGHLILVPWVFNFEDQGLALDAILHLATLLAIIIFFRADLLKLAASLFSARDGDAAYRRVAWSILVACLPAGIVGLLWKDFIERELRNPDQVAVNLMLWSFVFLIADRQSAKRKNEIDEIGEISPGKIIFVGFAQAFALLPGTSRSGITIAAGLFGKLSKTTATRLSFLLGAPIIFAAGVHNLAILMASPAELLTFTLDQLLAGFIVAFIFGYWSIRLLFKIVARVGLLPFIVYRIALSLFILAVY